VAPPDGADDAPGIIKELPGAVPAPTGGATRKREADLDGDLPEDASVFFLPRPGDYPERAGSRDGAAWPAWL